jgi:hypothetical protein
MAVMNSTVLVPTVKAELTLSIYLYDIIMTFLVTLMYMFTTGINLLKLSRIEFAYSIPPHVALSDGCDSTPKWISTSAGQPTLPCVGCQPNRQSGLGRICTRAQPGSGWAPAELNFILQTHVDGALETFGCVEWETDMFRGVMRARCYPLDMPMKRFHGLSPKVLHPRA